LCCVGQRLCSCYPVQHCRLSRTWMHMALNTRVKSWDRIHTESTTLLYNPHQQRIHSLSLSLRQLSCLEYSVLYCNVLYCIALDCRFSWSWMQLVLTTHPAAAAGTSTSQQQRTR
jgi:hypothetical protein